MPPALQRRRGRHGSGGVGDQVRRGESLPHLLRGLLQDPFPSLDVYPSVEYNEQHGGDVESPEGGVDGVEYMIRVDAAAGQLLRLHLPPEERRQGDGDGDDPGYGHHPGRASRRALFGVLHRVRDGPVPIQCDNAQVEDGRRATRYVRGKPDVAHDLPQRPGVDDRVQDADGHHQDGHQQVGEGQGGDQKVRGSLQLLRLRDRCDDKRVGQSGGERDRGEDRRQTDLIGKTLRTHILSG